MNALPTHTERLKTSRRNEMVDVTDRVRKLIAAHRVRGGVAYVFVPHTTAACTINENADPDVRADVLAKLEALAPKAESYYKHAEGNSDAHVKASLVGHTVTVLIDHGRLVLGKWQGIYFCEFDGPRERELKVKVVSFDPGELD